LIEKEKERREREREREERDYGWGSDAVEECGLQEAADDAQTGRFCSDDATTGDGDACSGCKAFVWTRIAR